MFEIDRSERKGKRQRWEREREGSVCKRERESVCVMIQV